MATHSGILAWRIPMDRGAWRAVVHGVARSWTRLKRASALCRDAAFLVLTHMHRDLRSQMCPGAEKKKEKKDEDMERYTGTDEAETQRRPWEKRLLALPAAKEHQGWTTASRRFSFSAPGGTSPAHTWASDFQPPEQTSVALVCHTLLCSPGKLGHSGMKATVCHPAGSVKCGEEPSWHGGRPRPLS